VRAVEEVAAALAERGHAVEEAQPEAFSEYEERALHGAVLGVAEYRSCLEELEERLSRPVTSEDVEPFLWVLANLETVAASPEEMAQAELWVRGWIRRTRAWFEEFDLLVTPTVCEPAPLLESVDPHLHEPLELLDKMVPHMAFTEPWNATGQPAISLPLAWTPEGLPVGVQLVAGGDGEDLLLGIAADLLRDRQPRRPALHA